LPPAATQRPIILTSQTVQPAKNRQAISGKHNDRPLVMGSSNSFSLASCNLLANSSLYSLSKNKFYACICQAHANRFPTSSTNFP
jgi:hypothetical protein